MTDLVPQPEGDAVEKPKRGRRKAEETVDAAPAAEKKTRGRKKADATATGPEAGAAPAAGGAFSLMFQAPPLPTPVIGA
ncbi:hypothetical protein, partial [Pseudolysinimonas sp.]|uniref:hypothetical protein n=1 Tax=Pseudolysinimonas sp. TaxID=2680009 RepID=UPI00286D4F2F